jgi:hypothetical protein
MLKRLTIRFVYYLTFGLLSFVLIGVVNAQANKGTDALPLGGEYSVQQVTAQCETRYNANLVTRFVADGFALDDDGDLRIGNSNRYREFKKTDQIGVYTSNVNGGPYRTITVWSETLFTEEVIWSDGSPCNTLMIYSFVRAEVPDQDNVAGIPLPRSSNEIGYDYNVNSVRENCTIYENGVFNRDNAQVNFKLQADGQLLVAQYNDIEGYSTASYFFQTNNPQVYIREYMHSTSVIHLISASHFQRETFFADGCTFSDVYFLPLEVFFEAEGTVIAVASGEASPALVTNTPKQAALINGVTLTYPADWGVSAGSDTARLTFYYKDEELNTNLEVRALTGTGLVFGLNTYDPDQLTMADVMTAYYQSIPPSYSANGVMVTDIAIGDSAGLRGELIAEERSRQFMVIDTGASGYVGLVVNVETRAQEKWQPVIDELIASLNTEHAFAGPAEFTIELDTGEVFNPATAAVEFIDFQRLQISFSMNGASGETPVIAIYPQLPFASGTYQLRDVTLADQVLGALVNIPLMIDGELYMLNYTSNVRGTLTLEYDGVSLSGTVNFTADFTQFIRGYEIGVTPDNPPPFPDSITVSGSFNHIVPPPTGD